MISLWHDFWSRRAYYIFWIVGASSLCEDKEGLAPMTLFCGQLADHPGVFSEVHYLPRFWHCLATTWTSLSMGNYLTDWPEIFRSAG